MEMSYSKYVDALSLTEEQWEFVLSYCIIFKSMDYFIKWKFITGVICSYIRIFRKMSVSKDTWTLMLNIC